VNRADALLRSGEYAFLPKLPGARLGCEATGMVESIGSGVEGFQVGDEVFTTIVTKVDRNGSYADRFAVPASTLLHRPAGTDAISAAATWIAYSTAFGALVERARVGAGNYVLITAPSSSVGLAAIQIVNSLGGIPVALTTSRAKVDRLAEAGARHVLVTEPDLDLAAAVRTVTGQPGVDVILDAIGGPGLPALASAARKDGVVVVYGWLDTRPAQLPMNWPLTVIGYNDFYDVRDPVVRRRMADFIEAGIRSGALVPTIDRVFALDDVVEAHKYLEAGGQFGKIILTT
jgi:NADPH2:quinone reductase